MKKEMKAENLEKRAGTGTEINFKEQCIRD